MLTDVFKCFSFTIFVLSFNTITFAFAADTCDPILIWGSANTIEVTNTAATNSALYSENCGISAEKMDSTQRAKAAASLIGVGSGDGSVDIATTNAKINQWCDKFRNNATANSASSVKARTIFAPSVAAWTTCKQLQASEIEVNPSFYDKNSGASFNIRYTGSAHGLIFYGVSTKNFSCTTKAPKNGGTVVIDEKQLRSGVELGAQAISITCDRDPEAEQTINGIKHKIWPSGYISINTAGRYPLVFVVPERSEPRLESDETSDVLLELQNTIEIHNRDIYTLQKMLEDAYKRTGDIKWVIAADENSCPYDYSYAATYYLPAGDKHAAAVGPFPMTDFTDVGVANAHFWTEKIAICKHN
ncbi:hypothetical protein [Methylocella sp.]|uniref:hypothetical protein n=1 Tax=Methylocella sp. TaxID=1978226 RepID=UPI0035B2EBC7